MSVEKKSVFVTGTAGRVGRAILPALHGFFRVTEFDLFNTGPVEDPYKIRGDITDFEVVTSAIQKAQPKCIVHLAANANQDAPSEALQGPNYQGTENIYRAAAANHVGRIVFASSLHTLSGYHGFPDRSPFPNGRKITPGDTPKPGNPYGESKVWGEQLARDYYQTDGIRTTILRLGAINNTDEPSKTESFRRIWLSHDDAAQLFLRAVIMEPEEPVGIYFAVSSHESPYDIQPTIDGLHYQPGNNRSTYS